MNEIRRDLQSILDSKLGKGKAIILIGPRQVGKTTLLKKMLAAADQNNQVQYWNCDEGDVRAMLSEVSTARLKSLIGSSRLIVIDEAQRVQNIGLTLKLIHDNFPDLQLAVTGSSSLDLSNTIN